MSADVDIDLGRIDEAARVIDPVFLHSPQFVDEPLSAALGRDVVLKVETLNPLHSFKGRGADYLLRGLDPAQTAVCATAGNWGQAVAYAGRTREIPVEIFVEDTVNPAKLERMRALGATVTVVAGPPGTANDAACEHTEQRGDRVLVQDGLEPAVAEGAGTIAVELLAGHRFDTIVVPVGDGALINGIARWVKAHAPDTRVVGVGATGSPAMAQAWRTGNPVASTTVDTIAEGIAIRSPIPESVRRMRVLVDDLVQVDDDALLDAMRLAAEQVGVLLEPSGAAGLAAIATHDLPGDRLATVLTGSNPRAEYLRAMLTQP